MATCSEKLNLKTVFWILLKIQLNLYLIVLNSAKFLKNHLFRCSHQGTDRQMYWQATFQTVSHNDLSNMWWGIKQEAHKGLNHSPHLQFSIECIAIFNFSYHYVFIIKIVLKYIQIQQLRFSGQQEKTGKIVKRAFSVHEI